MNAINFDLATITLQSGTSNADNCGANGLPMTPSSILMCGNFKSFVEPVIDPHVVQYVNTFRCKHEKTTIVFEHYVNELPSNMEKLGCDALKGLYELHYNRNCIHGLITPQSFVFDSINVKLTHWALNAMTECGSLLDADALLPNDCRFLPLEQLYGLASIRKSDVWSLALSLIALCDKSIDIPENPIKLVSCKTAREVLDVLGVKNLTPKWEKFFLAALHPDPTLRASVKELMNILEMSPPPVETDELNTFLRCDKLDATYGKVSMSISQVYHLWCLAFPQRDDDEKPTKPPIFSIPKLILHEGGSTSTETVKKKKNIKIPRNENLKLLQLEKLVERINSLPESIFYPLILTPGFNTESHSSTLPLIIRETDFNYQCERILLFKRLIEGSPFVRQNLLQAAKVDIPPFFRAHCWASILNVKWSDLLLYEKIDKMTPTTTDRQISVDIPRCHQYNDLLASPQGHIKLTRILKAWLSHNESNGYVYWQGLDSLASPFIILNFSNEKQAFACFNAFINKYLKGFFQRDNSQVIQEYLALFSHMIAFHDPKLYNHLNQLGFMPDLYAIPWFLTMFTHVLPLHKIMHLWDTLLLGNETFPLCIGLAILLQLRDQLLEFTFNDCILIFSDLPEINIEKCVKDAIKLFCSTPKSVSSRGMVALNSLRSETAPRIDVNDVISLLKNENTKIIVLETRSKEEVARFGEIACSVGEDYNFSGNEHHFIIVLNDCEKAAKLINENIPRVSVLKLNGFIPNELLA